MAELSHCEHILPGNKDLKIESQAPQVLSNREMHLPVQASIVAITSVDGVQAGLTSFGTVKISRALFLTASRNRFPGQGGQGSSSLMPLKEREGWQHLLH